MKYTQKLKTAIKLLREVEEESKNNYFTINKTKYFVNKNNLYKNEDSDTPVGSIKNGVVVFKDKKGTIKRKLTLKSSKITRTPFEPSFEPVKAPSFEPSFESKPVVDGPFVPQTFPSSESILTKPNKNGSSKNSLFSNSMNKKNLSANGISKNSLFSNSMSTNSSASKNMANNGSKKSLSSNSSVPPQPENSMVAPSNSMANSMVTSPQPPNSIVAPSISPANAPANAPADEQIDEHKEL